MGNKKSKVQDLIKALADCLHDDLVSEDMCLGVYTALDAVPVNYHWKAFAALLGMEVKEEAPDNF